MPRQSAEAKERARVAKLMLAIQERDELYTKLAEILEERSAQSEWRRQAACADPNISTDTFFATRGDVAANKARAICAACPVRVQCSDFAVDEEIHEGIWGQRTSRELQAIRAGRLDRDSEPTPVRMRPTRRRPAAEAA